MAPDAPDTTQQDVQVPAGLPSILSGLPKADAPDLATAVASLFLQHASKIADTSVVAQKAKAADAQKAQAAQPVEDRPQPPPGSFADKLTGAYGGVSAALGDAAHASDTPGGWLDQFMSGAATRGYRVDFIALHWYGSDFSAAAVGQLRNYVQAVYNRYHKPIWLTEYALTDFGSSPARFPAWSQQAAFVTASTAMLERLPYLRRYAWFALPSNSTDGTVGLYRSGAHPTAAGRAFAAVGG